jgi:uncharacterized protein (TIGR00375 family)
MVLEEIAKWCRIKGIGLVGTSDFTHPAWFSEIKNKLKPRGNGFYYLEAEPTIDFLLSTEISLIYSQGGKGHRIHLVVMAPDIETVQKINERLGKVGNIWSDGRPIFGLNVETFCKLLFEIDSRCVIIPAHIWTPWFSLFGSMSGFDTLEECFGEYSKYIFALETGLSSDPQMNWRLSKLDQYSLVSNSDAHSLQNLGREANVFETEKSTWGYNELIRILKDKDQENFLYTIEYFPEEGMYHFDGHRSCGTGTRVDPADAKKNNNICPVCKKPITVGVLHRVEDLADRKDGGKPDGSIPFKKIMPLDEIISKSLGVGEKSKAVEEEYNKLINHFGTEFAVLLDVDPDNIKKSADARIGEGIDRVRNGKLEILPGYDGTYGVVKIFSETEKESGILDQPKDQQASLF